MMSSIQQFYQDCLVKFALMGLAPCVGYCIKKIKEGKGNQI
jgi:hypothetical protein